MLTLILVLLPITAMATLIYYAVQSDIAVFSPAGQIASEQRKLLTFTFLLGMLVVIPVFLLTLFISLRYREGGKAAYRPNWHHSRLLETIWWGVPLVIIVVLGVVTWRSTHVLDPYKPVSKRQAPLQIQVVALQWKWLFLYPESNVASVNRLALPEDRPIEFVITSDAPMNSFWIPRLGSQIYAMSGMKTRLNLIGNERGNYEGMSTNISGEGFSDMRFQVSVVSDSGFDNWTHAARENINNLDENQYKELAIPGKSQEVLYGSYSSDLFNTIVNKYMSPANNKSKSGHSMGGSY